MKSNNKDYTLGELLQNPKLIDSMKPKQMASFIREQLFVNYNKFIEENIRLLTENERLKEQLNDKP